MVVKLPEKTLSEGGGDAPTREEMEWVLHSWRMCRARLEKLPDDADQSTRDWLIYEDTLRTWCIQNRDLCGRFQGGALAWWSHMIDHARYQIARYGNRITEDEFHALASARRKRRNWEISQSRGVAWLSREGK